MIEILTIGYGGKHPSDFFKELEELQADLIIDVRQDPYRAFLGVYTCPHLRKRLKKYIWIRELGNKVRELPPQLVNEKVGLDIAVSMIKSRKCKRVVLLCAEKDENRCHRKYVKEKLQNRFGLVEVEQT